jgi:predicted permease
VRRLRHSPGFTATALLTLALGIGATVTIFSIVNGVLLKPLPYAQPQQLVDIREVVEEWRAMYPTLPVNPKHYGIWRQRADAFSGWALLQLWRDDLSSGDRSAIIVPGAHCSRELFSLLGVQPMLGRDFSADEMQEGHQHVVVLTSSLWRERFAADPQIVGKSIRINGYPYTVIGVLPGNFELPSNGLGLMRADEKRAVQLFVPLVISPETLQADMGEFNYQALARLKPGVSLQQAQAQLNAIEADISNHLPPDSKGHLSVEILPLKETVVGGVSRGLWLLFAAVGCVLLIVCINLANLQLVRGVLRARETAVRAALGASRADLLAGAIAESAVLAAIGGALGVLVCSFSLRLLPYLLPGSLPRITDVRLDAAVLGFSLLATTVSLLLAGVLPAMRNIAVDPHTALQSGGTRTAGSRAGARLRTWLVATEVLCSTALLLVAALLARSFVRLMNVDAGFQTQHILTMRVHLPRGEYEKNEPRNQFYDRALQQLSSLPGVEALGFSSAPLMNGETWIDGLRPYPASKDGPQQEAMANIRFSSPGFLPTMGMRVVAGRLFTDADRNGRPAVVSESAARKLWPGENPIGRSFQTGDPEQKPMTVVGVLADARSEDLSAEPVAIVYYPYWLWPQLSNFFVFRTAGDPRALAASVQSVIGALEPDAAVTDVQTMDQVVGTSVAQRQFEFGFLIAFAVAALLLAALGLYGVLSYSVAERTREIGVRIALGARRESLYLLVFRQAAVPVAAGVAGGLALAWLGGHVIASMLFQVNPYDPFSSLLVIVFLAVTAGVACYWPARRAAHVEPVQALRME